MSSTSGPIFHQGQYWNMNLSLLDSKAHDFNDYFYSYVLNKEKKKHKNEMKIVIWIFIRAKIRSDEASLFSNWNVHVFWIQCLFPW